MYVYRRHEIKYIFLSYTRKIKFCCRLIEIVFKTQYRIKIIKINISVVFVSVVCEQ